MGTGGALSNQKGASNFIKKMSGMHYQKVEHLTDRKLARENVKINFHMLNSLNHKNFRDADKDVSKMQKNLRSIHKEISSGKAQKERR